LLTNHISVDRTETLAPRLYARWELTVTADGGTRLIQRWHIVTTDRQEQAECLRQKAA
jgi:hypothetical protein